MTDRDTITLPRKHIDYAAHALEHLIKNYNGSESFEVLVSEIIHHLRKALAAPRPEPDDSIPLHKSDCALLIGGYQCTCGFHQRQNKTPTALAAEPTKPSGYAYRYADNVLRFNDGGWLNGGPPVEAVPYWFAPPAEPTKQEPGLMEGLTELARQMKPLDADMAAILHDNLDSLYIEDEPALAAEPVKHDLMKWAKDAGSSPEDLERFATYTIATRDMEIATLREDIKALRRDAERLREELEEDAGVIAVWRGRTERAEAENERLREALALAERLAAGRLAMVEQLTGEVEALRRENERLTDEQIDSATSKERDDLLDHIYEYGTAAEGILERIRKLARAAIDAAMGDKR